jgi:hypothetical protein
MKKVFKYGTGQEIPEGAIYLNTQVEEVKGNIDMDNVKNSYAPYKLVWHYFLVEENKQ